jgi:hypothetical protein
MQKTFENEPQPATPPAAPAKTNESTSKNLEGPKDNGSKSPSSESATKAEPGVYVTVHDGQVILTQNNGQALDLNRGQTGFANDKFVTQLPATPKFMSGDRQVDSKESAMGATGKSATGPSQSGCVVK